MSMIYKGFGSDRATVARLAVVLAAAVAFLPDLAAGGNLPPSQRSGDLILGAESSAIVDRLPEPKVDAAALSLPCVHSEWKFSDQDAQVDWKKYAGLDNQYGFIMNQLMHWARAHIPRERFWIDGRRASHGPREKQCLDTDFVVRTWQATFGFQITGVLTRQDVQPFAETVAIVATLPSPDSPVRPRPLREITTFRFGMTIDELRPSLQPWCHADNENPSDMLCLESKFPCLGYETQVANHEKDIKTLNARMQSRDRTLATLDPRQRFTQSTRGSLNYEMQIDVKRLQDTQASLQEVLRKHHACEMAQSSVQKYAIEGEAIAAIRFVFEQRRLVKLRISPDDPDTVRSSFRARYGTPEMRDETTTEKTSYQTTEFDPWGMVITTHRDLVPRQWRLGTWYGSGIKIVEQPYGLFELLQENRRAPARVRYK